MLNFAYHFITENWLVALLVCIIVVLSVEIALAHREVRRLNFLDKKNLELVGDVAMYKTKDEKLEKTLELIKPKMDELIRINLKYHNPMDFKHLSFEIQQITRNPNSPKILRDFTKDWPS